MQVLKHLPPTGEITLFGVRTVEFHRDSCKIDPHDIHKAKVQMTMMDGVVRHQDGI